MPELKAKEVNLCCWHNCPRLKNINEDEINNQLKIIFLLFSFPDDAANSSMQLGLKWLFIWVKNKYC